MYPSNEIFLKLCIRRIYFIFFVYAFYCFKFDVWITWVVHILIFLFIRRFPKLKRFTVFIRWKRVIVVKNSRHLKLCSGRKWWFSEVKAFSFIYYVAHPLSWWRCFLGYVYKNAAGNMISLSYKIKLLLMAINN